MNNANHANNWIPLRLFGTPGEASDGSLRALGTSLGALGELLESVWMCFLGGKTWSGERFGQVNRTSGGRRAQGAFCEALGPSRGSILGAFLRRFSVGNRDRS